MFQMHQKGFAFILLFLSLASPAFGGGNSKDKSIQPIVDDRKRLRASKTLEQEPVSKRSLSSWSSDDLVEDDDEDISGRAPTEQKPADDENEEIDLDFAWILTEPNLNLDDEEKQKCEELSPDWQELLYVNTNLSKRPEMPPEIPMPVLAPRPVLVFNLVEFLKANNFLSKVIFNGIMPFSHKTRSLNEALRLRKTCKYFLGASEIYFKQMCGSSVPILVNEGLFSQTSVWLKTFIIRRDQRIAFQILNGQTPISYEGHEGSILLLEKAKKYSLGRNQDKKNCKEPFTKLLLWFALLKKDGTQYKQYDTDELLDGRSYDPLGPNQSKTILEPTFKKALTAPLEAIKSRRETRTLIQSLGLNYEDNLEGAFVHFIYPLETRLIIMFHCPMLFDDLQLDDSIPLKDKSKKKVVNAAKKTKEIIDCLSICKSRDNSQDLTLEYLKGFVPLLARSLKARALLMSCLFLPGDLLTEVTSDQLRSTLVKALWTNDLLCYLSLDKNVKTESSLRLPEKDDVYHACIKLLTANGPMLRTYFPRNEL